MELSGSNVTKQNTKSNLSATETRLHGFVRLQTSMRDYEKIRKIFIVISSVTDSVVRNVAGSRPDSAYARQFTMAYKYVSSAITAYIIKTKLKYTIYTMLSVMADMLSVILYIHYSILYYILYYLN